MDGSLGESESWALSETMLKLRRFEEVVCRLHNERAFAGHDHL